MGHPPGRRIVLHAASRDGAPCGRHAAQLGNVDKSIELRRVAVERRRRLAAMHSVHFANQSIGKIDIPCNKYLQRSVNGVAVLDNNIAASQKRRNHVCRFLSIKPITARQDPNHFAQGDAIYESRVFLCAVLGHELSRRFGLAAVIIDEAAQDHIGIEADHFLRPTARRKRSTAA